MFESLLLINILLFHSKISRHRCWLCWDNSLYNSPVFTGIRKLVPFLLFPSFSYFPSPFPLSLLFSSFTFSLSFSFHAYLFLCQGKNLAIEWSENILKHTAKHVAFLLRINVFLRHANGERYFLRSCFHRNITLQQVLMIYDHYTYYFHNV